MLTQDSLLSSIAEPFTEKAILDSSASDEGNSASPVTSKTVLACPAVASVQKRRSLVPDTSAPKNSDISPMSSDDTRPRSDPANRDKSRGLPTPEPTILTVNPPSPVANNWSFRLLPSRLRSRSTTSSRARSLSDSSRTRDTRIFSSAKRSISVVNTLGSMGTTIPVASLVNLAGIATSLARISARIN